MFLDTGEGRDFESVACSEFVAYCIMSCLLSFLYIQGRSRKYRHQNKFDFVLYFGKKKEKTYKGCSCFLNSHLPLHY